MSIPAAHQAVVWFFTVIALNGQPINEEIGSWAARGDCEAFRQEYIISHYQHGVHADTTLCGRRYESRT